MRGNGGNETGKVQKKNKNKKKDRKKMTTMKNMRKASSQCLGCGKYKHFLSD
jgi:hypothetical protein